MKTRVLPKLPVSRPRLLDPRLRVPDPGSRTSGWALLLFVLCLMAAPGCTPEDDRFAITLVSPDPVQQSRSLRLDGMGFGELVPGVSGVAIGSSCAAVLYWDHSTVIVSVPAGIGVGVKQVTLARGDGQKVTSTVVIGGADLQQSQLSSTVSCGAVFGTLPPPDAGPNDFDIPETDIPADFPPDFPRPDVPPDFPPIDVPFPDVPPTDAPPPDVFDFDVGPDSGQCPTQIGIGECTNASDCQLQQDADLMWTILLECTLPCLAEPQQQVCIQDCMSFNSGLSEQCSICWGFVGTCAVESCLARCAQDPFGDACSNCVSNNCRELYEPCAGTELILP